MFPSSQIYFATMIVRNCIFQKWSVTTQIVQSNREMFDFFFKIRANALI